MQVESRSPSAKFKCYSTSINILSPAEQPWSLIPKTFWILQNSERERIFGVPGTRTIGTNSGNIEVSQDNECIPAGALLQDRAKFGVKHSFSSASQISVGAYTATRDIRPNVCFSFNRITRPSSRITYITEGCRFLEPL